MPERLTGDIILPSWSRTGTRLRAEGWHYLAVVVNNRHISKLEIIMVNNRHISELGIIMVNNRHLLKIGHYLAVMVNNRHMLKMEPYLSVMVNNRHMPELELKAGPHLAIMVHNRHMPEPQTPEESEHLGYWGLWVHCVWTAVTVLADVLKHDTQCMDSGTVLDVVLKMTIHSVWTAVQYWLMSET